MLTLREYLGSSPVPFFGGGSCCSSFYFYVVSCAFCVLFVFVLCFMYPILPVSLDCTFLIDPSVLSKVYLHTLTSTTAMQNRHYQCQHIKNYVYSGYIKMYLTTSFRNSAQTRFILFQN